MQKPTRAAAGSQGRMQLGISLECRISFNVVSSELRAHAGLSVKEDLDREALTSRSKAATSYG